MRLGDLDALKKDIEENAIELGGVLAIEVDCAKALIDNAPTVDVESVKSELNPTVTCWHDFDRGYEKGYEKAKKELEERPQGEWIKWNFKTFGALGDWEYKCSNCEKVYGGEYNFCPNCGSAMQKGEHK